MNYVITGGAGHISKPLALRLLENGHQVTVIGRSAENLKDLVQAGAKAAVGSVDDLAFLNKTFQGADAVYLMIPPIYQTDNWKAHIGNIGELYAKAIQHTGVKNVVLLSSTGAHMSAGCGPVSGLYLAEKTLEQVPGINLLKLRPGYFFYNFLGSISMVKSMQLIGSNFGGNQQKLILSDTEDIASAAANALLQSDFTGVQVRYLVSDERTTDDIARVLGTAVNQPALPWVVFTDEQMEQGLLSAGLAAEIAKNYTEMGTAIQSGKMFEDYHQTAEKQKGTHTLEDFAAIFASAYTH